MWTAASLVIAGLSLALPQDRADTLNTLTLYTGSETGSYQAIGGTLARIIQDSIPELRVEIKYSSGSVENIRVLGGGDGDLAIVQNDLAYRALRQTAMFEGWGGEMPRAIMGLHAEHLWVIAQKNDPLTSARQIEPGSRIVVGTEGSGTFWSATDIFEEIGHDLEAFVDMSRSPRESLGLLGADSADYIFLTAGVDPGFWETVDSLGGKPLTLGEDLISILEQESRYYQASNPVVGGQIIPTVRVRAILLARADFPADRAAQITEALHSGIPEVAESHVQANQMFRATARDYVTVPFHNGAAAYYCEIDEGPCRTAFPYLLGFLVLLGLGFVSLAFSSSLRKGLARLAPGLAEKLVGPHGVTDRYKYLVIPVLGAIIILGGALLIQKAEIQYAKSNNVVSDFEDRGLAENLLWTLVFTATGEPENVFPRSPAAKVLSSLLGLVGIGGVILLVSLVTSDQLARKMKMQMAIDPQQLDGHVILCGWNPRAAEIISRLTDPELGDRRQTVVVVAELDSDPVGDYDLPRDFAVLLKGSPTDLGHMRKAGLDRADTVIILADETVEDPDSQTVLTVLQAEKHAHRQQMNGDRIHELRTVAELVDPQKKSALESVHTDLILCPQEFSEKILFQALLNPGLTQFLGEILSVGEENQIVEVPVQGSEAPTLVGKTFDQAMTVCREKALLLLAIHRGGAPGAENGPELEEEWASAGRVSLGTPARNQLLTNPQTAEDRDYRIRPGDSLLFLARGPQPLAEIFGSPLKWKRAFKA